MIRYCKEKWDENREKLESALRTDTKLNDCDYKYLLSLIVENILNPGLSEYGDTWDSGRITEIDNGNYQGTLLYLIPNDRYQPDASEYLMTFVDYGSCSGCDTLQRIQSYGDVPPTDQQLKDYMALCKDIVMNIIKPYNYGWRADKKYEVVEMPEV